MLGPADSLRRALVAALGVAAGLGIAGAALVRRPLPQRSGRLLLPGLAGPVRVQRDRSGIPHIYATSEADLFMAQGYVHAQDRLWQMELHRRTGHGQLAEMFGPVALEADRFMRVLGFSRVAAREQALLDDETRAVVTAYVRGVNAFVAQAGNRLPLEYTLLGCRPRVWDVRDVLVWSKVLALNLCENWTTELLRARLVATVGAARAAALEPQYPDEHPLTVPPGARYATTIGDQALQRAAAAQPFTGVHGQGQGSNAWVVGGSRSASARPLLANDPHLVLGLPALWYEMHLEGGAIAVTGASIPGLPMVLVGHTARIAWGFTNALVDTQDLYIERFAADDPLRYAWCERWEQAELVREAITVKGQAQPVIEEVRITRHGPIISPVLAEQTTADDPTASSADTSAQEALALSWTALQPSQVLKAMLDINQARNWDEFRAALTHWDVPPQNFVYADVDGHYGYALAGTIPIRTRGDGRLPVPGWSGAHEWSGYLPQAALPALLDPEVGLAVSANNRPAAQSPGAALYGEWLSGYRAARITAALEAVPRHDVASFARLQQDVLSLPGRELAALAARLPAPDELARVARDTLAGWDGTLTATSVGGAIYASLRHQLLSQAYAELEAEVRTAGVLPFALAPINVFLDRALPEVLRRAAANEDAWLGDGRTWEGVLAEAWRRALSELRAQLGPDVTRWQYGRMHRLALDHPLGSIPVLKWLVSRGPWPIAGDDDTVNCGYQPRYAPHGPIFIGSSYRQICDPADWDASVSSYPGGQSGHPGSRHYADLIRPWRRGQYHPMLWSRERVDAATVATLVLEPDSMRQSV